MAGQRWMILAVVFFARTSMGYQFQSIGSVGPLFVAELAIDFAVLGSLIGMYKFPGLFLALPSGLLGIRYGEKAMLVVGMGMMAVGGFLTAWSSAIEIVFAGRILSGIGAVLFNVLSAKMIADWFADKELTLALAIHVNSWPFGIALGLATHAVLAQSLSINGMLSVAAMFCAVGVVLLLVGSKDKVQRAPSTTADNATAPASTAGRRGLGKRDFVLVSVAALVWLLFNANLILVVSYAPAYLTSTGMDVTEAGQLASISTWLGIIAIPVGGYLVQNWISADRFISITFIGGCLSTFAIVAFDNPLYGIIAFGILAWAPAGAIFALPMGILNAANRSVGIGIYLSYYYLGIGIFPPFAGYLRDVTGDPAAPISFAAWLLIGGLLSLALLRLFQKVVWPPKVEPVRTGT